MSCYTEFQWQKSWPLNHARFVVATFLSTHNRVCIAGGLYKYLLKRKNGPTGF